MDTLSFRVGLNHTADYWSQFSLNGEETFEEGSRCLDASTFVGRICLEVMSIL
jgi:hypothetical protein